MHLQSSQGSCAMAKLSGTSLLGRLWPDQRVLLGLETCRWVRQELLSSAESVVVHASKSCPHESAELVARNLMRFCKMKLSLNIESVPETLLLLQALSRAVGGYGLVGLEKLNVSFSRLEPEHISLLDAVLLRSSCLTHLTLSHTHLSPPAALGLMQRLSACRALTHLNLRNAGLAGVMVKSAAARGTPLLPECLSHLDLSCNRMDVRDGTQLAQELEKLSSMTLLNLSRNYFQSNGWHKISAALAQCPELAHLHLQGCFVRERAGDLVAAVRLCSALRSLDLSDNSLDERDAGILAQALQQCHVLTHLDLSGTFIAPEGFRALAGVLGGLSLLCSLDLSNGACAQQMPVLAPVLGECTALTRLHLAQSELGVEGATVLAGGLDKCSQLGSLHLACNSLFAAGVGALLGALRCMGPSLTELELGANFMEEDGMALLADGLRNCGKLRTLNLDGSSLYQGGAAALASWLGQLTSLEALDVAWNELGAEGTGLILDALGQCPALRKLKLRGNGIDGEKTERLQGFRALTSLRELDLSINMLGDGAAAVLAGFLSGSTKLQRVDVSQTGMGQDGLGALSSALRRTSGNRTCGVLISSLGEGEEVITHSF